MVQELEGVGKGGGRTGCILHPGLLQHCSGLWSQGGAGRGQRERGTSRLGRLHGYECESKSCFSYLSHSGVGVSQLDHHREVGRCEL